jgi:hypothetical protein
MRAVLSYISDEERARRKTWGLDRHDEMWKGVLHMTPAPTVEHQRRLDELITFLSPRLTATDVARCAQASTCSAVTDDKQY